MKILKNNGNRLVLFIVRLLVFLRTNIKCIEKNKSQLYSLPGTSDYQKKIANDKIEINIIHKATSESSESSLETQAEGSFTKKKEFTTIKIEESEIQTSENELLHDNAKREKNRLNENNNRKNEAKKKKIFVVYGISVVYVGHSFLIK